jgi:hypothetical protein
MSSSDAPLAADLVSRLREFDWYGPPRKGADELLNAAADEIERLRTIDKLAIFGRMVLEESRDLLSDIDGGWMQDTAVKCGLLQPVEVEESCGDNCRCGEFTGFPTTCYRLTDAARAVTVIESSDDVCTCQPLAQQTDAPFGTVSVAVDPACPQHGDVSATTTEKT